MSFDRQGAHYYSDVMMDTNFYGPRTSKDTRLTVPNPDVHTVRTGNDDNLDMNPWRWGLPNVIDRPMSRQYETVSSNRGGSEGKKIVTMLDSRMNLNGLSLVAAESGGGKSSEKEQGSFISAGTVPETGPDSNSLKKDVGLNYTKDVGNSKELVKTSRENFMKSRTDKGIKI